MNPTAARSGALLGATLLTVLALLMGTVSVALRVPGVAGLGRLAGRSLDYARGPQGEFFPLTDQFVGQTLGQPLASLGASAGGPAGPAGASAGGPAVGGADPREDSDRESGNDDFGNAYPIRGLPYSARSADGGTREADEPTSCATSGGTRWYRFTPRSDVGLTATTAGSAPSTAVGVFTGTTLRNLRQVACASAATGDATSTFTAKRGTTYWFQVTKTVTSGAVAFSLDLRGTTSLVSVYDDGRPADADSRGPFVSGNGRYVAFSSAADLAPGMAMAGPCVSAAALKCFNVYVRDVVAQRTILVSTPDSQIGGNGNSQTSAITSDGRFVVFSSHASNLVPGDTNGTSDLFVRDLVRRRTTRVNLTSRDEQTTDPGYPMGMISANGRFIAFSSAASELPGAQPGRRCFDDLGLEYPCVRTYMRDIVNRRTHLVSVTAEGEPFLDSYLSGLSADGRRIAFDANDSGAQLSRYRKYVSDWQRPRIEAADVSSDGDDANGGIYFGGDYQSLSADGRYLAFISAASNLVEGDTNGKPDVFVRDLAARRTVRVSVSSAGAEAQGASNSQTDYASSLLAAGRPFASISPDGRYVAFSSDSPDLVAGDTNGTFDVFMHDLRRDTTTRVSVLDDGSQSSGAGYRGTVSGDGRVVAFSGQAFSAGDDRSRSTVYVRQRPVI